jgi:hypothetical protein
LKNKINFQLVYYREDVLSNEFILFFLSFSSRYIWKENVQYLKIVFHILSPLREIREDSGVKKFVIIYKVEIISRHIVHVRKDRF